MLAYLKTLPAFFLRPIDIFKRYRRANLRPDLLAGLTVSTILLPQAVVLALLAGLPAQMGLYAGAIAAIVAASHVVAADDVVVTIAPVHPVGALAADQDVASRAAADQIGARYGEYALDHRVMVEAQIHTARKFGFDYVSAISDPAREAADLGVGHAERLDRVLQRRRPRAFHQRQPVGHQRGLPRLGGLILRDAEDVDHVLVLHRRQALPELPDAKRRRLAEQHGLSAYDARVLASDRPVADYFEAVVAAGAYIAMLRGRLAELPGCAGQPGRGGRYFIQERDWFGRRPETDAPGEAGRIV